MNSSLLYLATKHPDLLANHAHGYLALARQAWGKQAQILRQQIIWVAIALACFIVAAVHVGLLAVLSLGSHASQWNWVWWAVLVPLVPLVAGGICLARALLNSAPDPFAAWNEQIATDLAFLRKEAPP